MNLSEIDILICDDSLLARKQLKDCVLALGAKNVFEASDGENAISIFKDKRPHLVFMDIIMPNKDGIETLVEMIEIDSLVKVIMISSVGAQDYVKMAIDSGAKNFLKKPIQPESVKDIIFSVIN